MKNTDLAWAAGFLDGEGCIGAYKHGARTHSIKVEANGTDPKPLEKLYRMFGGRMSVKGAKGGTYRPNERRCFTWGVGGKDAGRVLRAVLPYLVNKREQAELGIIIADTVRAYGSKKRLPDELVEKRAEIADQMKALKAIEYASWVSFTPERKTHGKTY